MRRLITICLVLLLCASAYGVKVSSRDDSTAIASMQVDVDILVILNSDELALLGVGTGNVFYVDKDAGGSGTGADWENAKTTIELAIGACEANAGDFIVCAPYHTETASTGTFDLDKDGVTLIGLGVGDGMTTISYDTTTDTCIMGASGDGCTIRNIKFIATIDSVVFAIVVEDGCTDFIIEDCVFKNETTTTDEFDDAIYIHGTAANNGIIRRNRFEGDKGANSDPQSSIGFEDAHFLQIYENEFSGDIAVAHIENKTTAANFITIRDNTILCGYIGGNLDTTPGITLFATTTGWITNNFVVTNVASPDLAIVAADCYLSGNTYSELQGGAFPAIGVGLVAGQTYTIVKVDGIVASNTDDPLFNIAGGPIEVVGFYGEVTTVLAGETSLATLKATDAVSSTQLSLSTSVDIEDDADGTTYTFSSANPSVLTPVTGNQVLTDEAPLWLIMPGTIECHADVVQSGVISWYMIFRPLTSGVVVTIL